MKNFEKTLFLDCRGCYFFDKDKITGLSDVGNYRIGAYTNEIKAKNGKNYVLEFSSTTRRALRKTNKRTGKPLKNPVIEITQENALYIDTEFENAAGCWTDLVLEKEIADMKLSYTKADILTAVNYISVKQYSKIVLVSSEKIITKIKQIYKSGGWRERNIIDNLTEIKTSEYSCNYWVFRFIASDGDYFEYEYNTDRITG